MRNLAIANPFSGLFVPTSGGGQLNPGSPTLTVGNIITVLLPYVYSISAMVLLVYLAISGVQLMTSRGDPKGVEAAKARITNGILGFVLLLLSYLIVKLIGQILGVGAITQIFS